MCVPGEKLFEELSTDAEHADKTKHPKVFIGRIKPHEWDQVESGVDELLAAARSTAMDKVRALLGTIVPEYATTRPGGRATPAAGEQALKVESQEGVSRASGSSSTIPN